jgi:hypothetical protein
MEHISEECQDQGEFVHREIVQQVQASWECLDDYSGWEVIMEDVELEIFTVSCLSNGNI